MKRKVPGCSGKVRHRERGHAIAAAKRIKNAQLSIYQCRHCQGWHLGRSHHPMKIQARLDQLLGPQTESPDTTP